MSIDISEPSPEKTLVTSVIKQKHDSFLSSFFMKWKKVTELEENQKKGKKWAITALAEIYK